MNEPSIFTRIMRGEIPSETIYSDDVCIVILTVEPLSAGHCLVIPRQQVDHLWDVDNEVYHHLMSVAKEMAEKLRQVYHYPRVGLMVEGFGVPHAHVHVFGLERPIEPTIAEHAAHGVQATPEELKVEADKLRA